MFVVRFVLTLSEMGIDPEVSHHEMGPGQNEMIFVIQVLYRQRIMRRHLSGLLKLLRICRA